jgi:drug/metabolite transporter (DMT)-like permease
MHFPLHLLFPLASSVGYVVAVLLVKRSAAYGVGLWRTAFVSNVVMGLGFSPLWLLGGAQLTVPTGLLWEPVITGVLFFAGQIFTFMALQKGDVSVATPMLGLKIIFVALVSVVLLAEPVPLKWWVAAGLSTVAIGLLGRSERRPGSRVGFTILTAAAAAGCYAVTDVLVQKWAPLWGVGRFLPIMFGTVAVVSVVLIPFFSAPLRAVPRAAWPWLVAGAGLLSMQAASMAFALGRFGDATAVNIVYSSRGLWSVLAVWLVGHWFNNEEQQLGAGVLRVRLAGAGLMLAAIALVVT